jgi:hypothetical protein
MNVKYRDKNRLRAKERYNKIGIDPSYQEKHIITVQRSRTLIDNEAFGAEASQRNEKHSADIIGMKYTKQVLTQRRQYWVRRSRLLARALEHKLILAKQKKMQQSSGVFMMDIKLLFNKAEYAVKKANLKLSKLHSSLETKVSSLLQHIPINRPVTECDIVTAFGDLRVHRATTEPYYWEQTYSILSFLKSPVPVNANGEAIVFAPIINKLPPTHTLRYEVHAKTDIIIQLQCNDTICKITQDYIDGSVALLREIVDTPSAKLMDFYLHVDECIELSQRYKAGHYADRCYNLSCTSLLRPARLMSSHFPRLRSIIRRLYEARRLCQCIRSVQMARGNGSYCQLKTAITGLQEEMSKLSGSPSETAECERDNATRRSCITDEDVIMNEFGKSLRNVSTMRDTYTTDSRAICEMLRKDLAPLKIYENQYGFNSEKMTAIIDLLDQEKTKYESIEDFLENTLVCRYCADKLKGNKDIARSVFNHLSVIHTPICIQKLNLFEKVLIKFTATCLTIVRLGQISSINRPSTELNSALKGRIAYLPVDISANAAFVPHALLNTDNLVLIVGGQPTKQNKIWTSAVDLQKVHAALIWLRQNNRLYKDIPAYSVEDIKKNIENRMQKRYF